MALEIVNSNDFDEEDRQGEAPILVNSAIYGSDVNKSKLLEERKVRFAAKLKALMKEEMVDGKDQQAETFVEDVFCNKQERRQVNTVTAVC